MEEKDNKTDIISDKKLAKIESKMKNLFKITDDLDGEPVYKSNCKLCNSQYRSEAEEKYMASRNFLSVQRLLASKGEKISVQAVKNHLESHMMKALLDLRMKDYAEDLETWMNTHVTKEERIENYLTLIERQIHLLGANTETTSADQLRKNGETITKLMSQAVDLEEKLEKHRAGVKPIMIFVERFRINIKTQLETMESAEARMALVQILESIEKDVEGILENE